MNMPFCKLRFSYPQNCFSPTQLKNFLARVQSTEPSCSIEVINLSCSKQPDSSNIVPFVLFKFSTSCHLIIICIIQGFPFQDVPRLRGRALQGVCSASLDRVHRVYRCGRGSKEQNRVGSEHLRCPRGIYLKRNIHPHSTHLICTLLPLK